MTPGPAAGVPRDRDAAGRPRNARPRDPLGRPRPRDPEQASQAPPDEPALVPAAALALAQRLIDDGRPFRAHEVLEASWRAAPEAERELWRGLAQVAVGLTHAQRGNARGAAALLRRGGQAVSGFAASGGPAASARGGPASGAETGVDLAGYGVDPAAVAQSAADLARRVEQDGVAALTPADLRLSLAGPAR